MSHVQIKPILHYNISLMLQQDVDTFHKQKKNLARVLRVFNQKILFNQQPLLQQIKSSSQVIKSIGKMKSLKTIRFQESPLMTNHFLRPSRARLIAKKVQRAESLSITDLLRKSLPLTLEVYLRNIKKLKKIDLSLKEQDDSDDLGSEKKIKRLLHWINRLGIKELGIAADMIENDTAPFLSQRYPSSLEKLSLSCEPSLFATKLPAIIPQSLNELTQLKALHFRIKDSPIIDLINSLTDLSHLMTLELVIGPTADNFLAQLTPFIHTLQQAKNLKSLSLFCSSFHAQNHLQKFLDAVVSCELTELRLAGFPNDPIVWDYLHSFVSRLQRLESLELSVHGFNARSVSMNLLKMMKQSLAKSVQLSSVILEYPGQINSLNIEEVIDILEDIAPHLRALRIFMNPYEPSQPQFAKMMKFLHSLKEIRSLDLPTVNICELEQFEEIVNWCCSAKSLNSLQLGRIQCEQAGKKFVELIKRIISKRGFESLFYKPSNVSIMHKMLAKMGQNAEKEMKQIRQKNPLLENYPELLKIKKKPRLFDSSSEEEEDY